MSRFHFCRRFPVVMGCSFREFIVRTRITRAKEMLRDQDATIEGVAKKVGFRGPAHFSRIFRRVERLLPSEYRRRLVTTPGRRLLVVADGAKAREQARQDGQPSQIEE